MLFSSYKTYWSPRTYGYTVRQECHPCLQDTKTVVDLWNVRCVLCSLVHLPVEFQVSSISSLPLLERRLPRPTEKVLCLRLPDWELHLFPECNPRQIQIQISLYNSKLFTFEFTCVLSFQSGHLYVAWRLYDLIMKLYLCFWPLCCLPTLCWCYHQS